MLHLERNCSGHIPLVVLFPASMALVKGVQVFLVSGAKFIWQKTPAETVRTMWFFNIELWFEDINRTTSCNDF